MVAENADKKVLLVTRSNKLTRDFIKFWNENPSNLGEESRVEILTYNQLAAKYLKPGQDLVQDGRRVFEVWFEGYKTNKSTKIDQEQDERLTSQAVWQEFRTCSGFNSADEYKKAGAKQTMFTGTDDRDWIIKAYDIWQQHCDDYQVQIAEFMEFGNQAENKKYDIVLVDEAQDLSGASLSNLMQLANNKQIAYCLDGRQSLEDDNPKTLFLQKLFHDEMLKVEPRQLTMTYRSAPNVMRMAIVLNDLRIKITPEKKEEKPIHVGDANVGEVIIYDMRKGEGNTQKEIERIQDDPDACIITTAEHQKRLKAKGYSKVFTPDQVKGLGFREVMLYNVFSDPVFKEINRKLNNKGEVVPGFKNSDY